MMPRWLAIPLLLGMGAVLLMAAYHGYIKGEVRAGTSLLAPYCPNRDENPLAFNFFLLVYFGGGLALCVWGLLGMLGMAPMPRWR
jgi:hypothetical protein